MLYHAFLIVHIITGTIGLLTGPLAIIVKKGGWMHRQSGLVFFYAMLGVAATALVLGTIHPSPFLVAVGIFSAYMDITGYRVLYQKKRGQLHQTTRFDHIVSLIMFLGSTYFIVYGVYILFMKDTFGLVFIAFAYGSLRMVWRDWKLFHQEDIEPNTWLKMHLARMIGTCIAAYTALLVVNGNYHFSLISWFLPVLIGLPILRYWMKKVKIKPARPVTAVVAQAL